MTENKYNINEIGLMVGYNTISAFSEIFKRVTGIRPSDYMAKITKYKNSDLKKA
jgi:AraC-like DNA-binding protein